MVIFIRYRSKLLREDFCRKIIMNNDGKKKGQRGNCVKIIEQKHMDFGIWIYEELDILLVFSIRD